MVSVKGITIGGRGLYVGFATRACRVKGKGYAIIIKGSVLYGPAGTPQRSAEIVLTPEQAADLSAAIEIQAVRLQQHFKDDPTAKLLEAP